MLWGEGQGFTIALVVEFSEIVRRCEEVLARVPPGVTVLAATKGHSVEEIRAAIRAGITQIGENYVQEAMGKMAAVRDPVTWHLISRLQKNKVRKAAQIFDWVQTLDSQDLAQRLESALALLGKVMPVLIEVNIGEEPQKGGALPLEVSELARVMTGLPHLHLRGLMAIPPAPKDPEDSRSLFRAMRRLFEDLRGGGFEVDTLSMGMSADWEVAVEEGATMIRLGTALFGPRLG